MPIITNTTNDQYQRQQYNLGVLQGIGNLAGTIAGGINDAKKMKLLEEQNKQQLRAQNLQVGMEMYKKAFDTNNYDLLKKSLTDYMEMPEQDAQNFIADLEVNTKLENTKVKWNYENVGNLAIGKFRMPDGSLKNVTDQEAMQLMPITLAGTQATPEHWGNVLQSMYGTGALASAIKGLDSAFEQELYNINQAKQNDPTLDTDSQLFAASNRYAVYKAKLLAAINKTPLPDDFGKRGQEEMDFQDALRKKALGKPLNPYEDKLVNAPMREETKASAELEKTKAETYKAYKTGEREERQAIKTKAETTKIISDQLDFEGKKATQNEINILKDISVIEKNLNPLGSDDKAIKGAFDRIKEKLGIKKTFKIPDGAIELPADKRKKLKKGLQEKYQGKKLYMLPNGDILPEE